MKAKPNYDSGYIKVEPKSAGDFGSMSFSGSHYKNDSHLKDMKADIERHTDRVRSAEIYYELYTCGECDENYDTEKEADDCCKPVVIIKHP